MNENASFPNLELYLINLKVGFGRVLSPRSFFRLDWLECVDPECLGERDFFFFLDTDRPRDFLGVLDLERVVFALTFGLTLLERPRFVERDALSFSISAMISSSFSCCSLLFLLFLRGGFLRLFSFLFFQL